MIDKNFMSLDLEMNMPSGNIIQVGACVGNLKSGEILEEYCADIHTNEILSDFIIKLTGIKQEDVDIGIHLYQAYLWLKNMHKEYDCFRNCICWGGGDSICLKNQLKLDDEMFLFGRRWIDAKTLFVSRCFMKDEKTQSGLAKSLRRMGLKFEGKKHNAKFDAINTFKIYRALLQEFNNEA